MAARTLAGLFDTIGVLWRITRRHSSGKLGFVTGQWTDGQCCGNQVPLPGRRRSERYIGGWLSSGTIPVELRQWLNAIHFRICWLPNREDQVVLPNSSRITSNSLLGMILSVPDGVPRAGERRTCCVAVTCARYRAHLLEKRGPQSALMEELTETGDRIGSFDYARESEEELYVRGETIEHAGLDHRAGRSHWCGCPYVC